MPSFIKKMFKFFLVQPMELRLALLAVASFLLWFFNSPFLIFLVATVAVIFSLLWIAKLFGIPKSLMYIAGAISAIPLAFLLGIKCPELPEEKIKILNIATMDTEIKPFGLSIELCPLKECKVNHIRVVDNDHLTIGKTIPPSESFNEIMEKAKGGDADAQFDLGQMHGAGRGTEQDYAEAYKWYQLAAEQGLAVAQASIGAMYQYGLGIMPDDTQAMKWYSYAAKQGLAVAQYLLASMYSDSEGDTQDYAEEEKWARRAAEQGNAQAQVLLGAIYAKGPDVYRDGAEAVKWVRRAAEWGNAADAQAGLGGMYFDGKSVPQNYKEAYIWISIAVANGFEMSREYRDALDKSLSGLSPRDLVKAQDEAKRRIEAIRARHARCTE